MGTEWLKEEPKTTSHARFTFRSRTILAELEHDSLKFEVKHDSLVERAFSFKTENTACGNSQEQNDPFCAIKSVLRVERSRREVDVVRLERTLFSGFRGSH